MAASKYKAQWTYAYFDSFKGKPVEIPNPHGFSKKFLAINEGIAESSILAFPSKLEFKTHAFLCAVFGYSNIQRQYSICLHEEYEINWIVDFRVYVPWLKRHILVESKGLETQDYKRKLKIYQKKFSKGEITDQLIVGFSIPKLKKLLIEHEIIYEQQQLF